MKCCVRNVLFNRLTQTAISKIRLLKPLIGHSVVTPASLNTFQNWNICTHIRSHSSTATPQNTFSWRTHTCGELRASDNEKDVVLCGWVQFKRMNFFTLRDGYGVIQVITNESSVLNNMHLESVLKVKGKVQLRPKTQVNPKLETGEVEVIAEEIEVLGDCEASLPFQIRDFSKTKESTRLQFRYLDLRNFKLQNNLRLRSIFVLKLRNYLTHKHGFVDVETPTLFRRTPGGAQEFLVPTQQEGKFYSLTQSPQQFKQLLMVGSIDRYFQVARCYRDESTRRDRQPEFTQLDLEMSFVTADNIMALIENTLQNVWPDELEIPFQRLTYREALLDYGTDKPDLRHRAKIQNITSLINSSDCDFLKYTGNLHHCAIVFDKNELKDDAKKELKDALKLKFSGRLYKIEVNDDMSWKSSIAKDIPSHLQRKINETLNTTPGKIIYVASGPLEKSGYAVFIDSGEIQSVHHPFTAPHPHDLNKLYDPSKLNEIRGQHYDLVLNGEEVGGGSVRIHNSKVQRHVLQSILKEDVSELQYFLDALESGCPPHAGIALGLDRLISLMCGEKNIRGVIAFPKSFEGKDLMSGAPAPITDKDRKTYSL